MVKVEEETNARFDPYRLALDSYGIGGVIKTISRMNNGLAFSLPVTVSDEDRQHNGGVPQEVINDMGMWLLLVEATLSAVPLYIEQIARIDPDYIFSHAPELQKQIILFFSKIKNEAENNSTFYNELLLIIEDAFYEFPLAALYYCLPKMNQNEQGFGVFQNFYPELNASLMQTLDLLEMSGSEKIIASITGIPELEIVLLDLAKKGGVGKGNKYIKLWQVMVVFLEREYEEDITFPRFLFIVSNLVLALNRINIGFAIAADTETPVSPGTLPLAFSKEMRLFLHDDSPRYLSDFVTSQNDQAEKQAIAHQKKIEPMVSVMKEKRARLTSVQSKISFFSARRIELNGIFPIHNRIMDRQFLLGDEEQDDPTPKSQRDIKLIDFMIAAEEAKLVVDPQMTASKLESVEFDGNRLDLIDTRLGKIEKKASEIGSEFKKLDRFNTNRGKLYKAKQRKGKKKTQGSIISQISERNKDVRELDKGHKAALKGFKTEKPRLSGIHMELSSYANNIRLYGLACINQIIDLEERIVCGDIDIDNDLVRLEAAINDLLERFESISYKERFELFEEEVKSLVEEEAWRRKMKEGLHINPETFGLPIDYALTRMLHKESPDSERIAVVTPEAMRAYPDAYYAMLRVAVLDAATEQGYLRSDRQRKINTQQWTNHTISEQEHQREKLLDEHEKILKGSWQRYLLDEKVQQRVIEMLPTIITFPYCVIDGKPHAVWSKKVGNWISEHGVLPEYINPIPALYHVRAGRGARSETVTRRTRYSLKMTLPLNYIYLLDKNEKEKKAVFFIDHALARALIAGWKDIPWHSEQYIDSTEIPLIDVDCIIISETHPADVIKGVNSRRVWGGLMFSFMMGPIPYVVIAKGAKSNLNPYTLANSDKCIFQGLPGFGVLGSRGMVVNSVPVLISAMLGFQKLRSFGFVLTTAGLTGIEQNIKTKNKVPIVNMKFLDPLYGLRAYAEAGYGVMLDGKRRNVIQFTNMDLAFPKENSLALWHILRTLYDLCAHSEALIFPSGIRNEENVSQMSEEEVRVLAYQGFKEFARIVNDRVNERDKIYSNLQSEEARGDTQLELRGFARKALSIDPYLFLILCSSEEYSYPERYVHGLNLRKLFPVFDRLYQNQELWKKILESLKRERKKDDETPEIYLARIIWSFPVARIMIGISLESDFIDDPFLIGEKLNRIGTSSDNNKFCEGWNLLDPRMFLLTLNTKSWNHFLLLLKGKSKSKVNEDALSSWVEAIKSWNSWSDVLTTVYDTKERDKRRKKGFTKEPFGLTYGSHLRVSFIREVSSYPDIVLAYYAALYDENTQNYADLKNPFTTALIDKKVIQFMISENIALNSVYYHNHIMARYRRTYFSSKDGRSVRKKAYDLIEEQKRYIRDDEKNPAWYEPVNDRPLTGFNDLRDEKMAALANYMFADSSLLTGLDMIRS